MPIAALSILHLDDALVAVDKPSGLAVHRGWAPERDVALIRARDQLGGAHLHPVHRLDRGASGVLLFARTAVAARVLSDAFAAGRVGKRYLALVRGVPSDQAIDHPLPAGEDPKGPRREARTRIRRLEVVGRYALVEATPETGRLHQIRRHLKHIACPILGDVNYGKGEHNRACRDRYGLRRLFLHAAELIFDHPDGGRPVAIAAPLAAELDDVLGAMRAAPPT